MDLHKKDYTELKDAFYKVHQAWQINIFQIESVKKRECEKYSEFVKSRADLRHLARENLKLHNLLVSIDLELQIRVWTGKND